jgi:hypothetical protein
LAWPKVIALSGAYFNDDKKIEISALPLFAKKLQTWNS